MDWKCYAVIYAIIAKLPEALRFRVHYFLQRKFGGFRSLNPVREFPKVKTILDLITSQGNTVHSKSVLEIGTGWRLTIPIGLYLCGASKITTIDLNPYLKEDLVWRDIEYMRIHRDEIEALYAKYTDIEALRKRLDILLTCSRDIRGLLDLLGICYIPRGDAGCLDLPEQSIDYHISYSVLEYISPDTIVRILKNAKRLLRQNGRLVHLIDLSDQFSHKDKSIPKVNFLQYSESKWLRYAGNSFAYQNRLRVDDYRNMLEQLGLKVLVSRADVSPEALQAIEQGLRLDSRFNNKDDRTNATTRFCFVASSNDTFRSVEGSQVSIGGEEIDR